MQKASVREADHDQHAELEQPPGAGQGRDVLVGQAPQREQGGLLRPPPAPRRARSAGPARVRSSTTARVEQLTGGERTQRQRARPGEIGQRRTSRT